MAALPQEGRPALQGHSAHFFFHQGERCKAVLRQHSLGRKRQVDSPEWAPMALLPMSVMLDMLEGSSFCCINTQVRLRTEGHRRP